jgi:hypothetical protein
VHRLWRLAYWILWTAFIATAALNMLHVRAGFMTNHAADVVVPALLYVMVRGLADPNPRPTLTRRWFGATPERAGAVLLLASAATEVCQYYWPNGIFRGRFDPWDIAAFGVGLLVCYACDTWGSTKRQAGSAQEA